MISACSNDDSVLPPNTDINNFEELGVFRVYYDSYRPPLSSQVPKPLDSFQVLNIPAAGFDTTITFNHPAGIIQADSINYPINGAFLGTFWQFVPIVHEKDNFIASCTHPMKLVLHASPNKSGKEYIHSIKLGQLIMPIHAIYGEPFFHILDSGEYAGCVVWDVIYEDWYSELVVIQPPLEEEESTIE